jgi:PTS system fructose-specific IIA component/PTS system nitrogen regulatory IIA component
MKLSELIEEQCITVSLRPAPKEQIIREMVDLAAHSERVVDAEEVYRSVIEREIQGSTGLGSGVAIPHAKSKGVTGLVGALGICPEGTDFEAKDRSLAYVIFLLEAIPDNPGPHIQALAKIAFLINKTDFVSVVRKCVSPAEVCQALQRFEDGLGQI